MGDYLTYAKITKRIPSAELLQLLDVAADGDVETVANDIIADVEAELLSYVEVRRTAPTAGQALALAAIAFRRFRFRALSDRNSVGDSQQKEFDADTKWLEAYRDGKLSLGDEGEATAPATIQHSADDRHFTDDTLKGW